ncbi:MAG: lysine--tRNA ligase [Candidatus Shapirobacteria bacterium]|nr:lysine--tRNA ligase [Candidatus Shapirobacteria bacterium]
MAGRLDSIRQERISKLKKLRDLGIDPYPTKPPKHVRINQARKLENKKVTIVGRIMAWRSHGGMIFADLKDSFGQIQIAFFSDDLGEDKYRQLELLDIGDFLAVTGLVFKTKRGEITVKVSSWQILTKSLRPLPNKWKGLKDIELRSRKRYLDLIVNDRSKDTFVLRSKIVTAMRKILDNEGFLEVETPTLQPVYGGASAQPFTTHHNALDSELYLKISDELYLKRLIVGGLDKVYEIDHNFRNEGIDKNHNPEFTLMECYWAYADYQDVMVLTEKIYSQIAKEVLGTTKISFKGQEINLKTPWPRMSMYQAIEKYLGWNAEKISDKELKAKLKKRGVRSVGDYNRGLAIAELFQEVEPYLIGPVFITDFPKETTFLCKLKPENPDLIERFEPYIAGFEIGNAYSELNDPLLQRQFLEDQARAKEAGDKEAVPMDEDFLEALEYGMPPTGGLGLGVDRLVMLLTDQENIRDVILFPTLKPTE